MEKNILVVLASQEKARFIYVEDLHNAYELNDKAFINEVPEYSDRPGRSFESTGPTRHALAPVSDKKDRLREGMAIHLSKHVKKLLEERDCQHFCLFIEPKLESAFKYHCTKRVLSLLKKVVHKNIINERFEDMWGKIKEDLLYEK